MSGWYSYLLAPAGSLATWSLLALGEDHSHGNEIFGCLFDGSAGGQGRAKCGGALEVLESLLRSGPVVNRALKLFVEPLIFPTEKFELYGFLRKLRD